MVNFFSLVLELSSITSERIIIEKRSWMEKLLRVKNIRNISIDQIALLSYSRAPFNYYALFTGIVSIFFSSIRLFPSFALVSFIGNGIFMNILSMVLLLIGVQLVWFGLRLTKRSINLEIIGLKRIISIGNVKGAPEWFLRDLEMMIYDKVHHTYHNKTISDIEIKEYPLKYSRVLKDLINNTSKGVQINILKVLTEGNLTKKNIQNKLPNYSKGEIDEAMRLLRKNGFVHYHRHSNCWCVNTDHGIESHNEQKR